MTFLNPEAEYAVREIGPKIWEVWKLDGHHMKEFTVYEVKIWHGKMYCSCPAGNKNCKHLGMVQEFLHPKKDLFT